MIGLPTLSQLDQNRSTRIWLSAEPADMRWGFDRLAETARLATDQDPADGGHFACHSQDRSPNENAADVSRRCFLKTVWPVTFATGR